MRDGAALRASALLLAASLASARPANAQTEAPSAASNAEPPGTRSAPAASNLPQASSAAAASSATTASGTTTEPNATTPSGAALQTPADPTAPAPAAAVTAPPFEPKARLPPPAKLQFAADPLSDGAVVSLGLGLAAMSEAIIGTGEITPQKPNSKATFLSIDRASIGHTPIAGWSMVSNVGLISAFVYAGLDPVQTGLRDGAQAGLVDFVLYGETLSTMWALTNLTKIAFRRPRPSAYRQQKALDELCAGQSPSMCTTPTLDQTDSALSFFSGHAATTASVFAAGTYLAFARSPHSVRPWLVLALGATITTLVDVGRVEAGKHFPTDVIAGSMVGVGIGIMVPHLHRTDSLTRRPVWVGFEPHPGGGALTLNGFAF
jgi:undecaprenyl-diphosphatase